MTLFAYLIPAVLLMHAFSEWLDHLLGWPEIAAIDAWPEQVTLYSEPRPANVSVPKPFWIKRPLPE